MHELELEPHDARPPGEPPPTGDAQCDPPPCLAQPTGGCCKPQRFAGVRESPRLLAAYSQQQTSARAALLHSARYSIGAHVAAPRVA
eukprot:740122-Prymnesium_polylepis.1